MPNLKDIRKRISSVKNTQKITKAMKMVAAAKLRRAQDAVIMSRPYVAKLVDTIEHLATRVDHDAHPLLRESEDPRRAALLVITGDRGLCGGYNTNVNKLAHKFVQSSRSRFDQLDVYVVGRKGKEFMKHRKVDVTSYEEEAWNSPFHEVALRLSDQFCEAFTGGELDELYVIYTRFKSVIAQEVVTDRVLPLRSIPDEDEDAEQDGLIDYIYEPNLGELLDALLPRAVMSQLHRAMLESLASEFGARMTAMDNATSNASEMIDSLTLQYNRARQEFITRELMDIIGGAEAV